VHLANEVLQHLLGDGEVGDYSIFHRTDSDDITGGTAQHAFGLYTDCGDALGTVGTTLLADGYY
jgi:hypothetical protein